MCIFLLLVYISLGLAVPEDEIDRMSEFGLEHGRSLRNERGRFEMTLQQHSSDGDLHEQKFFTPGNDTNLSVWISKKEVRLYDHTPYTVIYFHVLYHSKVPLVVSYDLDSIQAMELANRSWYWLPSSQNATLDIPVHILTKQIGLSYFRFWIREGGKLAFTEPQTWTFNSSATSDDQYYASLAKPAVLFNSTEILGFPIVVLRGKGVVQLIFRIVVILMVTLFTFTMGCELDPEVLKSYFRRPIGPAIGFACQFIIMPLVAFAVAKLVPIKREFGFGLLTIGCSPGGGASNAWALMLGGDLNLSIMMTFISSFSALFMMPLLLFIFGRFFIDVRSVQIPYGSICLQLLQIAIPALIGLSVRFFKPNVARRFVPLTRPMFIFFIFFFLTFGVYANWSIFRLIASYPIVMPTGALLPWIGFALAALTAFLFRQPRAIIITVALETGIQNVGAAILVLLYSMPQPAGDLGAVMPINVSMFTPVPLYFILLGITIRRRCCRRKPIPAEVHEVEALNAKDNELQEANFSLGEKTIEDDILDQNNVSRV